MTTPNDLLLPGLRGIEPDDGFVTVSEDATGRTRVRFRDLGDGTVDMDLHIQEYPQLLVDQIKDEAEIVNGRGKWGDGAVIGRVPLRAYFGQSGLAEALKQHDTAHIKHFFNDPDNAKLRIKRGRV